MDSGGKLKTSTAEDYRKWFDPQLYLRRFDKLTERRAHPLRLLHKLYQSSPNGLKILEYGCGPVLIYVISAATRASEIVLADYAERNREELQRWIDGSPEAYDWSPYFKFVVQNLEGQGERDVSERERLLRKVIKAVVPCDITKSPPIEKSWDGPYDVVTSSGCLEVTCSSAEDYFAAVARLAKLVKPGGKFVLNCIEGPSPHHSYMVGSKKFITLGLSPELVRCALEKAGLREIITRLPRWKYIQGRTTSPPCFSLLLPSELSLDCH